MLPRCLRRIDTANIFGMTPLLWSAMNGHTECVAVLARMGCALGLANNRGKTALALARQQGHHDTARLLSDIEAAGGWRQYAAECRMAYVLVRHAVGKTHAVLDEGHDDRELLHFLFGKTEVLVASGAGGRRTRARATSGGMHTLPTERLFEAVVRYLF